MSTTPASPLTISKARKIAREHFDFKQLRPAQEAAVAETLRMFGESQQQIALTEQGLRVAETRRDSATQALGAITEQRKRLDTELSSLAAPWRMCFTLETRTRLRILN